MATLKSGVKLIKLNFCKGIGLTVDAFNIFKTFFIHNLYT